MDIPLLISVGGGPRFGLRGQSGGAYRRIDYAAHSRHVEGERQEP